MAPLLRYCSDIVVMPRLILIKGTTQGGMEDHAWYRFDINHTAGPVLHNNRGKGEAIAPQRTTICEQCRKSYQLQRSTSRFCSQACKQQAYRKRLSVTHSVTPITGAAIEQAGSEVFRYIRHADVPRFTAEGWQATQALEGTHHSEYAVLMRLIEQG
jgi:hypothetical protein